MLKSVGVSAESWCGGKRFPHRHALFLVDEDRVRLRSDFVFQVCARGHQFLQLLLLFAQPHFEVGERHLQVFDLVNESGKSAINSDLGDKRLDGPLVLTAIGRGRDRVLNWDVEFARRGAFRRL